MIPDLALWAVEVTEPMSTYLGRCKHKSCKTALRVDDVVESCRSGKSVFRFVNEGRDASEAGVGYCVGNDGPYARCLEHGLYPLKTLKGRLVEDKKCDRRCTGATGPSCDCSCGGANHGADHS